MPDTFPNTFQNRTGSIPLSELDDNFTSLNSVSSSSGAKKIGINDAGSLFTSTDVEGALQELGAKVSRAGDTMTGALVMDTAGGINASFAETGITKDDASGQTFNFNNPSGAFDLQVKGNTVWHAGNDGVGSGLDSDLIQGQSLSYVLNRANHTGTQTASTISDLNTATVTFSNKTINLSSNTLTGTLAEFNVALSDGSFASLAGTETLTNKRIDPRVSSLTAGANIASNIDNFDIGWVVLDQNSTLDNPTGTPVNGQKVVYRVKQAGAGGFTLGFGTVFRFSGGTAPTMTATADKTDYFEFTYNGQDSKWDMTNVAQNF